MKSVIGIMGFPRTISIARKVAKNYKNQVDFRFITSALDDAISLIKKEEEKGMDIIIAGPGNSELLRKNLNIPIVPFYTTTRALIESILKAKEVSNDIAMVLSEKEQFDQKFFETLLHVKLRLCYCKHIKDYKEACQKIRKEKYKVIIGGSYAIEGAKSIGIKGVFSFDKSEILNTAIKQAITLLKYDDQQKEKITQMNILLQESSEGLFILDKKNRVTFFNDVGEKKFNIPKTSAIGKDFTTFFKGCDPNQMFDSDSKEIITKRDGQDVILQFHPVVVDHQTKGMVVNAKQVQEIEETEKRIRKSIHKKGFNAKYTFESLVGFDEVFLNCIEKSKTYSRSDFPVLIFGETGTGKEVFAQAIHNHSFRRDFAFVAINCATLPAELIESELFGYEKGAFTGAHTQGKIGLVELAHRGTLFLDEICSMSYHLQAKLLRLVQEKEFIRIGSKKVTPVDIRVISATNTNLGEAIKEGKFRQDLYYRLNTFFLKLPPIRERKKDIVILFLHSIAQRKPELSAFLKENSDLLFKELSKLPFSGNVRELQTLAERFAILTKSPDCLNKAYLQKTLQECYHDEFSCFSTLDTNESQLNVPIQNNLKLFLKEAEKIAIGHQYKQHTRIKDLSEALGIERSTLWRKLKEYEINPELE
jgi:transcriptional regulator, propionate catabolism operon regulatory protein